MVLTFFVLTYHTDAASNSILYSDIENHWAKESILEFTQNDILNGYSDNTFRPNENVTVVEFLKMLICAGNYQLQRVGNKVWPDFYIHTALTENLILQDEFQNYDIPIKRYEVVTIISRFMDLSGVKKNKNIFKDLDNTYEEPVLKLVKLKVINGYTDKTFQGDHNITRAEAVTILKRALSARNDIISDKKYDISSRSDLSNYYDGNGTVSIARPAYAIPEDSTLVIYDNGRFANLQEYAVDGKLIDIAKVNKMIRELVCENSYTMVYYIPSKYTINQLKIAYGESEDKIEKNGFDFAITYYEDKEYELSRISMEDTFSEKCYMKIEVLKLWSNYSEYLKGNYIDDYKKQQLLDVLKIEFGSANASKLLQYMIEKNKLYVSNQSKDKDYAEVKKIGDYVVNFYQPVGEIPKFFVSKLK